MRFKMQSNSSMPQTLRINFSYKSHTRTRPALHTGFQVPFALPQLMQQLQQYLQMLKADLLQPRQQVINRILAEAGK